MTLYFSQTIFLQVVWVVFGSTKSTRLYQVNTLFFLLENKYYQQLKVNAVFHHGGLLAGLLSRYLRLTTDESSNTRSGTNSALLAANATDRMETGNCRFAGFDFSPSFKQRTACYHKFWHCSMPLLSNLLFPKNPYNHVDRATRKSNYNVFYIYRNLEPTSMEDNPWKM